jgi:tetratricopeptide (TPR) repeat protein
VDDSPEPLKELRRLVRLQRAYNFMNEGDLAVERGDNEGALRAYSEAARLVPDNAEMIYWQAVALVTMGRVEDSLPLFGRAFALDRNWVMLTRRLPRVGLLPDDPKLIERIVREAR